MNYRSPPLELSITLSGVLLILAFIAFCFSSEIVKFHELWLDSYMLSHGYLTLLVSAYLIHKLPLTKLCTNPTPNLWIGLLLCLVLSVMTLAKAADIITGQLGLLPIIIILSLGTYLGWAATKVLAFPILIMIFAVPIWDDFSPFFQMLTVAVNDLLLSMFDIPAAIDGLYIALPVGTFFVAGGCSGVKYILVALFLSSVYSYLHIPKTKSKLTLIASSLLLAMASNWIRVFGIIVAGYTTDMKSSLVDDHEWWGWVIFILFTLTPLFFIAQRLERNSEDDTLPDPHDYSGRANRNQLLLITTPIIIVAMIATPNLLLTSNAALDKLSTSEILPPTATDKWLGPLFENSDWGTTFENTDSTVNSSYIKGSAKVHINIAHYNSQSQGKELVYYKNKYYNDELYDVIEKTKVHPNKNANEVNELLIAEKHGQKRRYVIWHWYQMSGTTTSSRIATKLIGALNRIKGDSSGSWIAISSECQTDNNCETSRLQLQQFVDSFSDYLSAPPQTSG